MTPETFPSGISTEKPELNKFLVELAQSDLMYEGTGCPARLSGKDGANPSECAIDRALCQQEFRNLVTKIVCLGGRVTESPEGKVSVDGIEDIAQLSTQKSCYENNNNIARGLNGAQYRKYV